MALDTQNRRRIAQGTVLPLADGVISAEDRGGVLGYLYFAPVVTPIIPTWVESALSDYEDLGTWRVESWEVGTSLRLTLRDLKTRLESFVAEDVFNLDDYPNVEQPAIGRTIPVIYGKVLGVPAFLVDTETFTFKVAAHAIETLTVYAAGAIISPDSTDLANGEFVWTAYDSEAMTVDTSALLANPADVIDDLLTTYGGEASGDLYNPGSGDPREGQGFGTYGSRTYWLLGETRDGAEVFAPALSIYIGDATKITDTIEEIEKFAFCDFYTGTDGLFTLVPWEPIRGQDVTYSFAEHEIYDAEREDQTADTVTRAVVNYKHDYDGDTSQVIVDENEEGRLLRGLKVHITEEVDGPFSERRDALQWGSRYTFMRSKPEELWNLEVTPKAWFLRPGDSIELNYTNRNLNGLFEVLSIEFTPGRGPVGLVVGNRRGFNDTVGFRSIDSPVFPATLGGGSAETWSAAWTDAQKQWARQNIMYFTDDNELAEATDADAFRAGAFT